VPTALLVNAVSFLVSAACLAGIRHQVSRPEAARRGTSLRAEIADGVRLVARDPYLRPMGLFGAVGNLALTGNQALAVVFLGARHRTRAALATILRTWARQHHDEDIAASLTKLHDAIRATSNAMGATTDRGSTAHLPRTSRPCPAAPARLLRP
jgi:hypothetical protein